LHLILDRRLYRIAHLGDKMRTAAAMMWLLILAV
jgi:hypothetical protein